MFGSEMYMIMSTTNDRSHSYLLTLSSLIGFILKLLELPHYVTPHAIIPRFSQHVTATYKITVHIIVPHLSTGTPVHTHALTYTHAQART